MIVASEYSEPSFVKELLRLGASTDVLDFNHESPLHKAVKSKIQPINKTLILIAHDPSLVRNRNRNGLSPLHYTAKVINPDLTKALLEQSLTEINAKTRKLLTPLHVASHFGNTAVVKILVQNDQIDINSTDQNGDTAAHHCAHFDHLEVYTILRKHVEYDPMVRNVKGLTVEKELYERLLDACRSGSTKLVVELVEKWGVPLTISRGTPTALHISCESTVECFQKVRFLISKRSRLISHRLPAGGRQAVHLAAQNKDIRVLNELANHFVTDINSQTSNKKTPLHITCSIGYTEHANLLLKKALIDVNIADQKGNTPLHIACKNGHLQIIHALKSHPMCRSDIKNSDNMTPDELTPYHTRVLELSKTGFLHDLKSVAKIPSTFATDHDGNTPLHELCFSTSLVYSDIAKKAELLINMNPSQLKAYNNEGFLPIHLAVKMQTVPLLVFLLKKYGNTALTHDGKSLLHVAARYDQTRVAALLLADENDFINSKDLEGNTPAHIATSCHHLKTLELIQAHPKFNPYAVNNLGETIDEVSSVNQCLWKLCKHGSASTVYGNSCTRR